MNRYRESTRVVTVLLAMVTLTGCVSVTSPGNYRPQSETVAQDYYACDSASTATGASVVWNAYGGSGNVGARTDPELLLRCMEARNYRLRKATTGEWVVAIIFLPVSIPLSVLTAGQWPGSDIRYGGGYADP